MSDKEIALPLSSSFFIEKYKKIGKEMKKN
jgi:hypothetical protein